MRGRRVPRFHIRIRERHRLLFLFLMGLIGCVLFLRQIDASGREDIIFGGQRFLAGLRRLPPDKELLIRFLWKRCWFPAVWIGLSFTAAGAAALYLFWIYLGFSMGILLWSAMILGGWRGPFCFWSLIFPQYLLYLPSLLLLYVACLRWNAFWIQRREAGGRWQAGRPEIRMFLLRVFLGICLYGIGIWAECCLNPWILKKVFIKS